uniref:Uncharacterized protein n=1 Tax=Meloidogyne enterolobii TaxID=390850 RepID=A0A6V7TT68_MELEN|nr:unnamed protein product [Meloidogyne enterolobii]
MLFEEDSLTSIIPPPSPTPLLECSGHRPSCSTAPSSRTDTPIPILINNQQQQNKPSPSKMGYFGATSYVIGNIIGSGIFIAPSTIIRHTESAGLSLLVWVIGALIAFLGSLCYIELGTSIREAGCDFAYICYVKWYSIAFSFMWVSVLMTYPATIAVISETFGQYLLEGV